MKTTLVILLLSCLLCSPGRSQQSHPPDDPELEEVDFKSAEIPWRTVLKDINQLLRNPNVGLQELRGYSLGGEFCVKHFFTPNPTDPKNDTVQGVLLWYCLNKKAQIPGYQNFLLAVEPMHKSQVNKNLKPDRPLHRPLATYPYSETGTSQSAISTYLTRPMGVIYCGPPAISDPSNHQQLVTEYENFLLAYPRTGTSRFNETNWAYFQNNYDKNVRCGTLTHLITQQAGIEKIRYYFGYDEGTTRRNTIRVILFAVDQNGKNITNYIVQKSIPPAKKKDARK